MYDNNPVLFQNVQWVILLPVFLIRLTKTGYAHEIMIREGLNSDGSRYLNRGLGSNKAPILRFEFWAKIVTVN